MNALSLDIDYRMCGVQYNVIFMLKNKRRTKLDINAFQHLNHLILPGV